MSVSDFAMQQEMDRALRGQGLAQQQDPWALPSDGLLGGIDGLGPYGDPTGIRGMPPAAIRTVPPPAKRQVHVWPAVLKVLGFVVWVVGCWLFASLA